METRYYLKVKSVKDENATHRTFEFDNVFSPMPGQFFMLTDYENGEKPFSVSRITDESVFVTIKKLGCFTSAMYNLKAGDRVAIRGPYGSSFQVEGTRKKALIIGGGCGIAPMRALVESIMDEYEILFISGARNKDEMLFYGELERDNVEVVYATDDGSVGTKGTVLDVLKDSVDLARFDALYTSGPEAMLKAILDYMEGRNLPSFFLIERYMKCAVGICGQCSVDPQGVRVCVEGPVFAGEDLAKLSEFGVYKRDASGTIVNF